MVRTCGGQSAFGVYCGGGGSHYGCDGVGYVTHSICVSPQLHNELVSLHTRIRD